MKVLLAHVAECRVVEHTHYNTVASEQQSQAATLINEHNIMLSAGKIWHKTEEHNMQMRILEKA